MRVFVTIPHYWKQSESAVPYGSSGQPAEQRARALQLCLVLLHGTFGKFQRYSSLRSLDVADANGATETHIDVAICKIGNAHALDTMTLPGHLYTAVECSGDSMYLGYECHRLLGDAAGSYDYYVYLEDDILIRDPWFFSKLGWFAETFGDAGLLQPNRYEVSRSTCLHRLYIDGEVAEETSSEFQDISDEPVRTADFLGHQIRFKRTANPHAGCFCLNANQMKFWSEQPYFLDRRPGFFGPLESAASLGIMRAFKVYKPAVENANFLEVQHFGDAWMKRILARRQRPSASVQPASAEAARP